MGMGRPRICVLQIIALNLNPISTIVYFLGTSLFIGGGTWGQWEYCRSSSAHAHLPGPDLRPGIFDLSIVRYAFWRAV